MMSDVYGCSRQPHVVFRNAWAIDRICAKALDAATKALRMSEQRGRYQSRCPVAPDDPTTFSRGFSISATALTPVRSGGSIRWASRWVVPIWV